MHSEAEHSLLNENVIKQQKRTSFQKCIWFLCAILTILASLSIAYISILNMIHVESIDDTGTIFLSFYMCLLTLILFLFEIIQIKPCTKIDHIYQRNFGFLYNLAGKGSYIILVGVMAFALDSDNSNDYEVYIGIFSSVVGLFLIFAYCTQ